MANFAKVDENYNVVEVIVIDDKHVNNLEYPESEIIGQQFILNSLNLEGTWIQTSYTAKFRKKFALVGDRYIVDNNIFISCSPYESWNLDENFEWQPPIPKPDNENLYRWVEETQSWEQFSV